MRADGATVRPVLRAAVLVGATPFAVTVLLSAVVAVLGAHDLDGASALAMTAVLTCATYGADQVQHNDAASTTMGQFPLLVTLVSSAAAVLVLRRGLRRRVRARRALVVAVAASLLHALLLVMVAVALRATDPHVRGYRADSNDHVAATGFVFLDGQPSVSVAGTAALGFVIVLVVLLGTVALHPGWAHPAATTLRRWLAAPVVGLGTLVAGSVFAGLVYLVAILLGDATARSGWQVVALVAVLPSLGLRLLALGAGAEVGYTYEGGGRIDDVEERLPAFADAHGALFWLSPAVLVLVLAAAAAMVVWRATASDTVLRSVVVYVVALPFALPLATRLANLHGQGDLPVFGEAVSFTFSGGVSGLGFTLAGTATAAVVAVLVVLLAGRLDLARIRERVRRLAAVDTWQ